MKNQLSTTPSEKQSSDISLNSLELDPPLDFHLAVSGRCFRILLCRVMSSLAEGPICCSFYPQGLPASEEEFTTFLLNK